MTTDLWVERGLTGLESAHSVGHECGDSSGDGWVPSLWLGRESSVWQGGSLLPAPRRSWVRIGVGAIA